MRATCTLNAHQFLSYWVVSPTPSNLQCLSSLPYNLSWRYIVSCSPLYRGDISSPFFSICSGSVVTAFLQISWRCTVSALFRGNGRCRSRFIWYRVLSHSLNLQWFGRHCRRQISGSSSLPSVFRSIDQQRCRKNEGSQHSRRAPILLSVFSLQSSVYGDSSSNDGTFFFTTG
eukprot:scaffold4528_cov162-Amphora_coffeaeformis.AAC.8